MSKKILVPVFPSDRFYEAVIRAGEILSTEGGVVKFAFTHVRPTPEVYANDADGHPAELDISTNAGDFDAKDMELWRDRQIAELQDARQLLYDRGISDAQIDYVFADEADHEGGAQAIADEAAAGAYDMVVLSHGYFEEEVEDDNSTPQEVAAAVQALGEVQLVVA
jgi:hypothetical protein